MTTTKKLLLASASPRRRELLRQLGVTFEVYATDIDESATHGESPRDLVQRLAREKALAGFRRWHGDMPTLGADTIVLLDDDILGKPDSPAQAESMLIRLSGRRHHVLSAVALVLQDGDLHAAVNVTTVSFGRMPSGWIRSYSRGVEPLDKAGAYAVQGAAGQYIRRIDGSYSGVMGLPLFETAVLLRKAALLD